MVFQDPYSSLNPRLTVRQALSELLRAHQHGAVGQIEARCRELMELVGLAPGALEAHPRHFSGGQRQRVSIARALALEPEVLVADEPVSALDVSVQATVLNLLEELQERLGLTMLFIAHNMAVVRHVCDRVSVMYLGKIVETAPTAELFTNPRHPYTQGLMKAVPGSFPAARPKPSPWPATRAARSHRRPAVASIPAARSPRTSARSSSPSWPARRTTLPRATSPGPPLPRATSPRWSRRRRKRSSVGRCWDA